MNASPSLDAGFLVGGYDEIFVRQRLSFPSSRVKVQHAPRLFLKIRIARKYPTAVIPRADRVLRQPSPDGRLADGGDKAASYRLFADFRKTEPRKRQTMLMRQFTGQSLHRDDHVRGKKSRGDPGAVFPQARPSRSRKNVFAIC